MFIHLSFLMLKYSISRRIMIIPFFALLIDFSFELLLAQGLPILIFLNCNSYEMFVKQSLENQEEEAKTSIMENRENKRTNRQNRNKILPHLMIFQWAQTTGKNHKQIQSKSATNISRCFTVNMIKNLTSFQVKPRKQRKKNQQHRCMNNPKINKDIKQNSIQKEKVHGS